MATRSKSKDSAAKPQQPAKPLKMPFSATGNRVAAETAPAAALSSAEVWDIYQAALQAQRRGRAAVVGMDAPSAAVTAFARAGFRDPGRL